VGGESLADKTTLTIGVKVDQPGIGVIVDGNPENRKGFDIDVANYVAEGLGAKVEWYDVSPRTREAVLENGDVDLVIAGYTVSANRQEKVAFAGPYLIVGQDIVVRISDAATVTGLGSLEDKKVCTTINSTSAERLVQEFGKAWDVPEHMVTMESIRQCINELLAGKVDAVSTDNIILAGYVDEQPDRLHLVGRPFTDDNIGVGLAKGNARDVSRINEILQEMIDDGTWAKSVEDHFGSSADSIIKNQPKPGEWKPSWLIPSSPSG
jgi:glutamate transport system substrate-binding protein